MSENTENTGTPEDPSSVTEDTGLAEGDFNALRADAGMSQLPGHSGNLAQWEASEAGKEFLEGEDDNVKEAEEGAEKAHEGLDEEGRTEAEAKFFEAVDKGEAPKEDDQQDTNPSAQEPAPKATKKTASSSSSETSGG